MYTAVIADDEVWIRKWLEQVLSNYDKEIRVAASLDDGLKVKEFLEKEEADILISDIRMPGMTGLELARWLREQGRTTKVMIISGYSDFEYAKEALHWNAVDYILKPIKRDEFTGALQTALCPGSFQNSGGKMLQGLPDVPGGQRASEADGNAGKERIGRQSLLCCPSAEGRGKL